MPAKIKISDHHAGIGGPVTWLVAGKSDANVGFLPIVLKNSIATAFDGQEADFGQSSCC
jgi:hypothetical protein